MTTDDKTTDEVAAQNKEAANSTNPTANAGAVSAAATAPSTEKTTSQDTNTGASSGETGNTAGEAVGSPVTGDQAATAPIQASADTNEQNGGAQGEQNAAGADVKTDLSTTISAAPATEGTPPVSAPTTTSQQPTPATSSPEAQQAADEQAADEQAAKTQAGDTAAQDPVKVKGHDLIETNAQLFEPNQHRNRLMAELHNIVTLTERAEEWTIEELQKVATEIRETF